MDERAPVRPWLQWALGGGGVLLVAFALTLVLRGRAPAPTPAVQAPTSAQTSLHIQHDGPTLKLRWNPNSPDVRKAQRGALVIQDGGRESRLELNGGELRAGVASYWPESREVEFRLELDGAQAGSVRTTAQGEAPRPSPFANTERPRKRGVPIKRVQAMPAAVYEVEPKRGPPVIRKIPLLRRLWGKRDRNRDR
jgi:hypothetical protein